MRIQRVREQFVVTIPKKMALKGGFSDSEYAFVEQSRLGDLLIRRIVDDTEEKEDFQRDRSWADR